MKYYKNDVLPLKIRKSPTGPESINVWNNKGVVYNRSVDISSLNVDTTSSIHFVEGVKTTIDSLTVKSGEMLLINNDCIILNNVIVESNGEMSII